MEVNQDLWTEEQPIMFNSLNLDKGIQQHSSSPGNHEKSRFSYHLPEIKCYHEYMHNIVNSILVEVVYKSQIYKLRYSSVY